MVSYLPFIATMAVSFIISEMFSVKLKSELGVIQGHWK